MYRNSVSIFIDLGGPAVSPWALDEEISGSITAGPMWEINFSKLLRVSWVVPGIKCKALVLIVQRIR